MSRSSKRTFWRVPTGFRPGKNAHQAIDAIAEHLQAGYADDFVVLARYQGDQLIEWIENQLEGRFRLTINRSKTQVVNLNHSGVSLDFLGLTFRFDQDQYGRDRRYLNVFPAKKSVARARNKLRELTDSRRCFMPTTALVMDVSRWMHSWGNYFRHSYSSSAFRKVNRFATQCLTRHLQRRSQRPFRPPKGKTFYAQLQALGLRYLRTSKRDLTVHASH